MNPFSRRDFIRTSALSAAAVAAQRFSGSLFPGTPPPNELLLLARSLAADWARTLLNLQVTDSFSPNYGTMIYPPENKIHGRMGDTFYPFFILQKTPAIAATLTLPFCFIAGWKKR